MALQIINRGVAPFDRGSEIGLGGIPFAFHGGRPNVRSRPRTECLPGDWELKKQICKYRGTFQMQSKVEGSKSEVSMFAIKILRLAGSPSQFRSSV